MLTRLARLRVTTALLVIGTSFVLTSCASRVQHKRPSHRVAHINTKTKFSSKEYGVKGSPRVTTSRRVRKGGGRYQVGKAYKVRGKWYRPKEQPFYNKVGIASWYGPNFHGRLTANGEVYDQYSLSAAHPTLPLPSYAKVTNLENGASVIVRVNDRGPFAHSRIIDLSAQAAKFLNYTRKGVAKVRVKYIGKARMDGRDNRYLMASYKPARGQKRLPGLNLIVPGATRPGTMLASIRKPKTPVANRQPAIVTAYTPPPRSEPVSVNEQVLTVQLIPVPMLRPTPLYEGTSMNLVGNLAKSVTIVTGQLQPVSYLATQTINRRVAGAFERFDMNAGTAFRVSPRWKTSFIPNR